MTAPIHGVTGYEYQHARARGHHAYNAPRVIGMLPKDAKPLDILDAGCGSGYLSAELAKLGHRVVGIDISPDGIELAKAAYPGVAFFCRSALADISDLRPQEGFDAIVSTEVIEHLYSPEAFLREIFKNLKPGGKFVVTTPYYGYLKNLVIALTNSWDRHHMVDFEGGHIKLFSKKTLFNMMARTGFEQLQFGGAGRAPFLWKSMAVSGEKPIR